MKNTYVIASPGHLDAGRLGAFQAEQARQRMRVTNAVLPNSVQGKTAKPATADVATHSSANERST